MPQLQCFVALFVVALASYVGIAQSNGAPPIPVCSDATLRVFTGTDAATCVALATGNVTFAEFCAIDTCRTFIKALSAAVPTDCTIEGVNVKGLVIAVQGCAIPTTVVTPSVRNCDAGTQGIYNAPHGSACTSRTVSSSGAVAYAKFCGDDDCKGFYQELSKAPTTDCMFHGVNLGTFLSRIKSACPDIAKTIAPAVTPTVPVVTATAPVETTTAPAATTEVTPTTMTTAPAVTTMEPLATTTAPPENLSTFTTTSPPMSARTTTPTPANSITTEGGYNTAVVAAGVGGIVVIVVLLAVILVLRKRKPPVDQLPSVMPDPPVKDDDVYAAFSNAGTDTRSTSVNFPMAHALRPFQIPFTGIKFGQVISRGGYGEVLRGMYDNEVVAIKRLLPVRRDDPQGVKSFVKEIRLTASLKHECVVRFIGAAWVDTKTLCMVSEFMHGGDLRNMLVKYSKTHHPNGHDDYKLRIAVQVAHAMTYLHSLDPPVVHRDLKSRNILLSASGNAKIIDFGVSCERQDLTMTAGVGTSLWMAPEVMSGDRYSEKADVFSFGVILSELDTHELPYDHARNTVSGQKLTDYVLLEMIRHGRLSPRFTDRASPAIVQLARDCVQLDPASRPSSSEVLYRLGHCLEYEPFLTEQTRTALSRGVSGLYTYTTPRQHPTSLTFQMGLGTRATTQAAYP